jgi:signal transduction histidine kinase
MLNLDESSSEATL